ncbi:hypothetical protein JIG36_43890 [Actinoplanes sp. LDG1-06]|uniref:Uncharacterized protein n=1 Tax=Paractinoplanes ovalisporus TaxID=2810368 RepID=A0ABS2ARR5_9ACTN|nr:hypothetical protein [Actinoplanes ovalisporus]MBM2622465.1 hypothetical protein [Actinoplanes ovalisporus]
MGNQETTAVHIGLHDIADLRWPKEPLSGQGPRRQVAVPLPRLPWSAAAVEVPLGESAQRDIARVLRLRKIFGYGVAPAIILLFVVADVLLIWGRFGSLEVPGGLFGIFGLAGVILILTGLLPDAVARATGTPYVSRGRLRLPAARNDVLKQLVKLNPAVDVSGWPSGDMQSRR